MSIRYIIFDLETKKYLATHCDSALTDDAIDATFFYSIDLALGTAKAFELSFVEIKTIYQL